MKRMFVYAFLDDRLFARVFDNRLEGAAAIGRLRAEGWQVFHRYPV